MRQFAAVRAGSVLHQVAAAGGGTNLAAPLIFENGIINAANPAGALTPGGVVSLFGERLANAEASATGDESLSLAGAMLLVNGARAPLLYVSPTQINAQIPWDTTAGQASFTVTLDGVESNTLLAAVAEYGPGIFSAVRQGDTAILYGTGFGPVDSTHTRLVSLPEVTLDGTALPLAAAAVPGQAGVFAITVTLPAGAAGTLRVSTPGGSVNVLLP
jgi:uncharacterized protein (TIGR03437 family)